MFESYFAVALLLIELIASISNCLCLPALSCLQYSLMQVGLGLMNEAALEGVVRFIQYFSSLEDRNMDKILALMRFVVDFTVHFDVHFNVHYSSFSCFQSNSFSKNYKISIFSFGLIIFLMFQFYI